MNGTRLRRFVWMFGILAATASCEATPVAVSPSAQGVEIAKADPPKGSREIGPIEAVHGNGCGGFGAKGTYESALAELRNQAAEKGGNYVQLMTMTEPHSEHGCFDDRFIIRGIVYRVSDAPVEPPVAKAAPDAASAPPAPPVVTLQGSDACVPACRKGFVCTPRGQCVSACNPPCAAGEKCTEAGECVKGP
jgi:hypothetical protein